MTMTNSRESGQLKEQTIKLKLAGSVEDAATDEQETSAGSTATNRSEAGASLNLPSGATVPSDLMPANRSATAPGQIAETDERKVVELAKKPDSDEFLRAIEELSPDQIARVLHALNERNNWYAKGFRQLTTVPEEPRTAMSIVGWWESRRVVFNLLVGVAGLPTVLLLAPLANVYWILEGVVAYAIAANICYTAGSVSEILARHWWAVKAKHFGPILFTLGLSFSIAITLLAVLYMPLVRLWLEWMLG